MKKEKPQNIRPRAAPDLPHRRAAKSRKPVGRLVLPSGFSFQFIRTPVDEIVSVLLLLVTVGRCAAHGLPSSFYRDWLDSRTYRRRSRSIIDGGPGRPGGDCPRTQVFFPHEFFSRWLCRDRVALYALLSSSSFPVQKAQTPPPPHFPPCAPVSRSCTRTRELVVFAAAW